MIPGFSLNYFFTKYRSYFNQLYLLLGFNPHNISLYKLAFYHKSLSLTDENGNPLNNERLEFVGDAVLDAIVADLLYNRFPSENEGRLSLMRANIVSRKSLDKLSVDAGIVDFVVTKLDKSLNQHLAGNAFEALIGAIYYDRGYYKCKKFINRIITSYINWEAISLFEEDYKSLMFQYSQKMKWSIKFDTYEAVEANEKKYHFISQLSIKDDFIAQGKAWSKKEAEQNAANNAIIYLKEHNLFND